MRHDVQIEVLKELMGQLDAGVNADAGGVARCPASTYTSRELAAREWRTFFREHPHVLAMSADLPDPGSFVTGADLGIPVLLTRDETGSVRAFLNSCRHRGPVVEHQRRGRKLRFSCRFHAWTYDSRGALVGIPQADQFGPVNRHCRGLIELPAAERYGFILVHPDPAGTIDTDAVFQGLDDDFAHWGWQDYQFGTEQTLDMRLNWKLATDTFGETYHFKRLHRDTLANDFHGDVLSYRTYERNHRMVLCLKGIDQLRGRPEADWDISHGGFPVYFLFPNVVINVGERGIAVVRVYPDPADPGRSISQVGYYFDPAVLAAQPQAVEEFSRGFTQVVADEDYALAESTQRALQAGLQTELLFGRNEPPLHHYHNTFRQALGMDPLPLLSD